MRPFLGIPLIAFPGLSPSALVLSLLGVSALTVLLYILRLRRRPLLVPFLPLWENLLLDKQATALKSRLQRFLSLLLSLLLVGALVLALASPRLDTEKHGRSVVVLLDVGAAMAEQESGVSRLDLAKQRIQSWLGSFVGGDQILIVEMGVLPRPLLPFTTDMTEVEDALSEVRALDVHADLGAALAYGRDVLRGRESPQLVVVSAGALAPPDDFAPQSYPPIAFESVAPKEPPRSLDNVAVTAFSARRYPLAGDRFEVLVEAVHRGTDAREVELVLYQADDRGRPGAVVELSRIRLEPDTLTSRSFENLAHAEHGLVAEVRYVNGPAEIFGQDNVARTLLAPRTPVSILVVGEPNTFLDAALLVEDSFVVKRVSADEYPPPGNSDVTIFDGVFPPRVASTGAAIYFGAPSAFGETYPVEAKGALEMFGFDTWSKDSIAFRLIDPYDVQVLRGSSLVPRAGDEVLGRSDGQPIFVSGKRDEGRFLALGFSPTQSDFVLRAVWPLFVVNLIDEVFPRGRGSVRLGYPTGEVWRPPVTAQPDESRATVVGPLHWENPPSQVVPVSEGRAVIFGEHAGFFEARTAQGVTRFASSLPALPKDRAVSQRELRLSANEPLPPVSGMEQRPTTEPWYWLLVGVLGVSFLEWWTFHRRWTV